MDQHETRTCGVHEWTIFHSQTQRKVILDSFSVQKIITFISRMNENMEFPGATGEYIEWLQNSFVQIIQAEVSETAKNPFIKKEERGKVP